MRQVKLIRKKEFAATILNLNNKDFVIYITLISQDSHVYISQKAQIASLKADKALIFIPHKYDNFVDIFFKNLTAELPKHIKINDHFIDLIK